MKVLLEISLLLKCFSAFLTFEMSDSEKDMDDEK